MIEIMGNQRWGVPSRELLKAERISLCIPESFFQTELFIYNTAGFVSELFSLTSRHSLRKLSGNYFNHHGYVGRIELNLTGGFPAPTWSDQHRQHYALISPLLHVVFQTQ
jgi:hypothetical protein